MLDGWNLTKLSHMSLKGKKNVVIDVLARRYILFTYLDVRLFGFDLVKELYANDCDLGDVFIACGHGAFGKFYRVDGYLY